MQFMQLQGITSLPIRPIGRQFRGERVRAVLPARLVGRATDALLVATASRLAIVVEANAPSKRWKVRWAPFESVRLSDGTDPWTGSLEDEYELFVEVGRGRFESRLAGDRGRRVLRDFVAAVSMGSPDTMATTSD